MPEKILVVDDEPDLESLILQKFRKKIREEEYEFVFATNGLEALTKLLEHKDVGVILSDINMPEMDGLTLLAKLNELQNPAIKTVMVSAYGDMDNIRTAMNNGAYDFVTKPVDFADLARTIEKTLNEINLIRKSLQEHKQLVAIQHDLETARSIQLGILPKTFPAFPGRDEFDIYAAMEAAKEVGGDLYDFFMIDHNHLGIVIGDVSGKGVPAAIFMAVSRTLIRATALKGQSPASCFNYVNSLLCVESVNSMFVTAFYGILDLTTGELVYANAGHNFPYVTNSAGEVRPIEGSGGIPLGLMDFKPYEMHTTTINPGDMILLYTDGVTEAMNKEEELYSEERLEKFLSANSAAPLKDLTGNLFAEIHSYANGMEQSDDITTLAVRYIKKA